jgi:ubiquinone/menaquinone biosynthesis C-methylase UbiE
MPDSNMPKICDYEGSSYRTDFWEGKGRDYEDRVERIALRRLLPPQGTRLLEIGAGFGRLTDEYSSFEQVVIMDYSFSQLQYAQEHFGTSGHYIYVAADAYHLPFRPGAFDAATMIRVIHHMADVPKVLQQIRHILAPEGVFILEHANKRNAKAMLRYALRKQNWSPYSREPVEFVELNFDFHPAYIKQELANAGFDFQKQFPVSFFRLGLLKKFVPTGLLVGMDRLMQHTALTYSPSIFTKSVATGKTPNNIAPDFIFTCPDNGGELTQEGDTLVCHQSGLRYAIRDGIYDFKAPIE